MIQVKIVADSIYLNKRITTLQLVYPRFIHAEFMTHRTFCLAGDSILDFDLPNSENTGDRRVYHMTIREFVKKWQDGSKEHKTARHNGNMLETLDPDTEYSAKSIAAELGFKSSSNLHTHCRNAKVPNAYKSSSGAWYALGKDWMAWRASTGIRTFALVNKLKSMHIRQMNEVTGEVITSKVVNCVKSGVKEVFRITTSAGYSVVCSKDHLIFTNSGWKPLRDIKIGADSIATYKYGTGTTPAKFTKIEGQWVCQWIREHRYAIAKQQGNKCYLTKEPLEPGYHIHHLMPKSVRPDLAFDLTNVVAVNPEAHKVFHKTQGWQVGVSISTQFSPVISIESVGTTDTYDLEIEGEFANFFADGVVVHNSRNASSSRAVPVAKNIEQVRTDPAMPVHWGKNQAGMQAREELGVEETKAVKQLWLDASAYACEIAAKMSEVGAHKQIVNRILEPFQNIHVVVTATEWQNFFNLRIHKDAQPEIRLLAELIYKEMQESTPRALWAGEWHLPYITENDFGSVADLIKCSAARCARVSYIKHDGTTPSKEDDIELFNQLVTRPFTDKRGNTLTVDDPIHASPIEHQATPNLNFPSNQSNNFVGWTQFREIYDNA